MSPVRYKVGYHSSHEAPETKIIMRSSSQDSFIFSSHMFHHPDVHDGAIAHGGKPTDEDTHQEQRQVWSKCSCWPNEHTHQKKNQHGFPSAKSGIRNACDYKSWKKKVFTYHLSNHWWKHQTLRPKMLPAAEASSNHISENLKILDKLLRVSRSNIYLTDKIKVHDDGFLPECCIIFPWRAGNIFFISN